MSRRRILARLPFPGDDGKDIELVLAERHAPGSHYVRFESSCLDILTGEHSHHRMFVAARPLRSDVLRVATEDFVKRYLTLVVNGSFKGDRRAAFEWVLTRLGKELPHGAA